MRFWGQVRKRRNYRFRDRLMQPRHQQVRAQVRIAVGARVGPSGHGWPYSCKQGLVNIAGPTVVFLAANTGNERCVRPSAQL